MIKRFTLGLAFIFASLTLAAQDTSHLRLHIDFANANGRNIPDKDTGSGITAKTVSSAAVEAMGPYSVLNLGNSSGYLDLTRNTGAIIKTLSDFTFSVYYRVDESASLAGNGYFLFSFSQMLNNTDTSGPYIAHRLNAQRMAISTGGYTNEHGMELGTCRHLQPRPHRAPTDPQRRLQRVHRQPRPSDDARRPRSLRIPRTDAGERP